MFLAHPIIYVHALLTVLALLLAEPNQPAVISMLGAVSSSGARLSALHLAAAGPLPIFRRVSCAASHETIRAHFCAGFFLCLLSAHLRIFLKIYFSARSSDNELN